MSSNGQNGNNILINPAEYSDRLKQIEPEQGTNEIARIESHLAHRLRLGGAITYLDEDGNHVIEDKNGIRPFPEGSEFPAPPDSAELEIRELAFRHGVQGTRTAFDDWTESVTALAGDEIQSDEVELMVIGLGRLDAVDGIELTKLHARYLQEIMSP